MTVTPDAPRPDLDEADPLHALSRESQTRAIAYTSASPAERHVLFGLLLADYDQQVTELDRLRAIETAARAVFEYEDVVDPVPGGVWAALRDALGEA